MPSREARERAARDIYIRKERARRAAQGPPHVTVARAAQLLGKGWRQALYAVRSTMTAMGLASEGSVHEATKVPRETLEALLGPPPETVEVSVRMSRHLFERLETVARARSAPVDHLVDEALGLFLPAPEVDGVDPARLWRYGLAEQILAKQVSEDPSLAQPVKVWCRAFLHRPNANKLNKAIDHGELPATRNAENPGDRSLYVRADDLLAWVVRQRL